MAKIRITDVPKKYAVTTSYNNKTYKNTVTVKQVLTAFKVTVKKTAKKFTLKAKLKINGKLVKGNIQAENEQTAGRLLIDQGYIPETVTEEGG